MTINFTNLEKRYHYENSEAAIYIRELVEKNKYLESLL